MEDNKQNNENQHRKWEIYYGVFTFFLFGLYVGFIFRGSESWIVPIMLKHDFTINFIVVLCVLAVLYLIIHEIIEHRNRKK